MNGDDFLTIEEKYSAVVLVRRKAEENIELKYPENRTFSDSAIQWQFCLPGNIQTIAEKRSFF